VGQQVVHADLQPLGAGGGTERALVSAIENSWLPKRVEQLGRRVTIGAGELVARHPVTPLRRRLLSEHRVEHQISCRPDARRAGARSSPCTESARTTGRAGSHRSARRLLRTNERVGRAGCRCLRPRGPPLTGGATGQAALRSAHSRRRESGHRHGTSHLLPTRTGDHDPATSAVRSGRGLLISMGDRPAPHLPSGAVIGRYTSGGNSAGGRDGGRAAGCVQPGVRHPDTGDRRPHDVARAAPGR
jgi:hypothetical protein